MHLDRCVVVYSAPSYVTSYDVTEIEKMIQPMLENVA